MTAIDFKRTNAVLDEFAKTIISEYRSQLEADNNSNGELYNTLSYTVSKGTSGWLVSISLADYWRYVEYGRRPGKMPPVSAIENWIKVKQILPRPLTLKSGKSVVPTIPQLSFLIARKIGIDGTQGKHYFENAFEKVKRDFLTKIAEAVQQDIKETLEL